MPIFHPRCFRFKITLSFKRVRIYLDESANGTDGWGTLNYWTANAYNKSMVTVSSGDYKITKGDYYSVKGAHSVFQDDIIETTTTCTDAIPIN